ncbi:hypothetical protein CCMSSC00406_0006076 [Pleurotus cornucopiae]|uniref:Uncharacterized protein n=1 Tax=Pleurotus cornucopiae TaxID=5321 RepID=A0ACB7J9G4_PLECO|nr:hypothetical protein CCMSSC00406_0006076 [Pleurotus cornucopiae]
MDPLSVTAAVVSFVDIARRIMDSVEKVGQTRQNLQLLVEDIVAELTELQTLCHDGRGRLTHIDPDSTRCLQNLHSSVRTLLHIQFLFRVHIHMSFTVLSSVLLQADRGLSAVKHHFLAWLKNAEIEGQILRLRARISAVHRRFAMIASLRAERVDNELLVATSEMRGTMNRVESLLSPLLISSHASGTYPASALDHDSPDGFDYQFLHMKVRRAADLLARISATCTFPIEESRGAVSFEHTGECKLSQATLMRSTTIRVLETLQLLELKPSELALHEGADHLIYLGLSLLDLGLADDAAPIFVAITNIYQRLMHRNPHAYRPYVVWGLERFSWTRLGSPEGLDAARRAVGVCREAAAACEGECAPHLISSLHIYSRQLDAHDHPDEALACAAEALALQRQAPHDPDAECRTICWEASGEAHVALSAARAFARPYETAVNDMLSLWLYGDALAAVGQWAEALIIATEVVQCLRALVVWDEQWTSLARWLVWWHEKHGDLMVRICAPGAPLAASITVVDDLDEFDELADEGGRGEGASGSRSVALIRT